MDMNGDYRDLTVILHLSHPFPIVKHTPPQLYTTLLVALRRKHVGKWHPMVHPESRSLKLIGYIWILIVWKWLENH